MAVRIPVDEITFFVLPIRDARIEAELREGRLRGVLGGEIPVEDLIDSFQAILGDGVSREVFRNTLNAVADLSPRPGACDGISVGLSIEGVPAVILDR